MNVDSFVWAAQQISVTGTGTADVTYHYVDAPASLTTADTAPGTLISIHGFNWIQARLLVASTPGGTTPTLDSVLQSSFDGANWFTLFTFVQLTTTGSEIIWAASRHMLSATAVQPWKWGRYLRWKHSVGSASGDPIYVITPCIIMGN